MPHSRTSGLLSAGTLPRDADTYQIQSSNRSLSFDGLLSQHFARCHNFSGGNRTMALSSTEIINSLDLHPHPTCGFTNEIYPQRTTASSVRSAAWL